MNKLITQALCLLLRLEWASQARGFKDLLSLVREEPVRVRTTKLVPVATLCRAIDYASIFYFKPVLCLQRSAATALLLRRHGWAAELVIGAELLPFRSHAWCEIEGSVVNDKPYMAQIYAVLERC